VKELEKKKKMNGKNHNPTYNKQADKKNKQTETGQYPSILETDNTG